MTVADLRPIELYGLIMLALGQLWFVSFLVRAQENRSFREKAQSTAIAVCGVGLPALIGLLALIK